MKGGPAKDPCNTMYGSHFSFRFVLQTFPAVSFFSCSSPYEVASQTGRYSHGAFVSCCWLCSSVVFLFFSSSVCFTLGNMELYSYSLYRQSTYHDTHRYLNSTLAPVLTGTDELSMHFADLGRPAPLTTETSTDEIQPVRRAVLPRRV